MMKSSMRRCSLGSTHWSGLKVPFEPSPRGTWQAILVARSSVRKRVMALAPDFPASSAAQLSSTPQASGVTSPTPVTTTLRMRAVRSGGVGFVDVLDGIADGHDRLRRIIGNFDAEFLFERHDELDRVEAVGAKVLDEGCAVGDFLGIDIEMFDDDLLHALCGIAH